MTSTIRLQQAVRTIAETAIENESYFCELDAAAGDGDFGYSLARGFEVVLEDWDALTNNDDSQFLRGIATTLMKRLGGTSGPIWGTAFLHAGTAIGDARTVGTSELVQMLDAAIGGIMKRGNAAPGDKTLLDALCPMRDQLALPANHGVPSSEIAQAAAAAARAGADSTKAMQARRGRASYVAERSVGSVDPGAVAVATMAEKIAAQLATVAAD